MAERMDRQRAVEQAISQIEKQFGRGSIMKMDEERLLDIPAISTGSLALDLALGVGGVPRGRVVEIYGPEASGKTTLALHVVAEAQARGGMVAFIDAEHALDVGCRSVGQGNSHSSLLNFCLRLTAGFRRIHSYSFRLAARRSESSVLRRCQPAPTRNSSSA